MFRLAVLCLCLSFSFNPVTAVHEAQYGTSFDWGDFVSGFVGMDVVEGITQVIDDLYMRWRHSLFHGNEGIEDQIFKTIELFKSMTGIGESDFQTGVQNFLLTNALSSIKFLQSLMPKTELLEKIEEDLVEPLEAKLKFPEGFFKAILNLSWTLRTLAKPMALLYEILSRDEVDIETDARALKKANLPEKITKTIRKILLPIKIAKDIFYITKLKVLSWIRSLWFSKNVLKDLILAKLWTFYSDIKNLVFSKVSFWLEGFGYIKYMLFTPMKFIVTRLLDEDQTDKCLAHNFCRYGLMFLRPPPRFKQVLHFINRIMPLQKFPVIFMEDLLRKAAKLMSNPELAAALVYGKENGNCKKYPEIYCA